MRKPAAATLTPTERLFTDCLARNLYPTLDLAVVELLTNAIDAATSIGVVPEMWIRLIPKGGHPLSPHNDALSVLNNAGIADISVYQQVGFSSYTGKRGFHGTQGLGKLAALACGPRKNPFYYLTTSTDSGQAWRYRLLPIPMQKQEPEPVDRSDPLLHLPAKGPFTEILIPRFDYSTTFPDLSGRLTMVLPMRPWNIWMMGPNDSSWTEVAHRSINAQVRFETPHIETLGGPVLMEFGIAAEGISDQDAVLLVDADTRRIVAQLHRIPDARRRFDEHLLNSRVFGAVYVHDLEDKCSTDRQGLQGGFWNNLYGLTLTEVLNTWGVEQVISLTGREERVNDAVGRGVAEIADEFLHAFGEPDPPPNEFDDDHGEDIEIILPNAPPRRRRRRTSSEDNGTRKPREPKQTDPDESKDNDQPDIIERGGKWIRIGDTTYQVKSYNTGGDTPAQASRGPVIVFNANHPEVEQARRRHRAVLSDTLRRAAIEAHIQWQAQQQVETGKGLESSHQALAQVYRLLCVVREANQKEKATSQGRKPKQE